MGYSQNDEERYILEALDGVTGKFLDIGAYDGKTFSNTLALIERGWSGVCFEPSPTVFPLLAKLHERNPSVVTVNKAVLLDDVDKIAFYDSGGDAVSTTSGTHKDKWSCAINFTETVVDGISLVKVFETYGYDCDFINIDVEGVSADMFFALPMDKLTNVKCLCVEHDGHSSSMVAVASRLGFRKTYESGENIVLARS